MENWVSVLFRGRVSATSPPQNVCRRFTTWSACSCCSRSSTRSVGSPWSCWETPVLPLSQWERRKDLLWWHGTRSGWYPGSDCSVKHRILGEWDSSEFFFVFPGSLSLATTLFTSWGGNGGNGESSVAHYSHEWNEILIFYLFIYFFRFICAKMKILYGGTALFVAKVRQPFHSDRTFHRLLTVEPALLHSFMFLPPFLVKCGLVITVFILLYGKI